MTKPLLYATAHRDKGYTGFRLATRQHSFQRMVYVPPEQTFRHHMDTIKHTHLASPSHLFSFTFTSNDKLAYYNQHHLANATDNMPGHAVPTIQCTGASLAQRTELSPQLHPESSLIHRSNKTGVGAETWLFPRKCPDPNALSIREEHRPSHLCPVSARRKAISPNHSRAAQRDTIGEKCEKVYWVSCTRN